MLVTPAFFADPIPDDITIQSLQVGTSGRVMDAPSRGDASPNISVIFIYGHHALIERWWGLIAQLREYGRVIAPDLPGFGGMSPCAGDEDLIDQLAQHVKLVIDKMAPTGDLILAGVSFGFAVLTRLLECFPELIPRVRLLVSFSGFVSGDNLNTPLLVRLGVQFLKLCSSYDHINILANRFLIRRTTIASIDRVIGATRRRSATMSKAQRSELVGIETFLWRTNDLATHWSTMTWALTAPAPASSISVCVTHVSFDNDPYVLHETIARRLREIFNEVAVLLIPGDTHTPDLNAPLCAYTVYLPDFLRDQLRGIGTMEKR